MVKNKSNVKTNAKMDELRAIKQSPELTEFILNNKIKCVHKNAIILGIFASVVTFICGLMLGLNVAKISTPQNVVEVKLDAASVQGNGTEGK